MFRPAPPRPAPSGAAVLWLDRSGASAVEFAIIAPLFLLMMFGMIAYGIYFGAAHSVQQLAADAARASVAGLSTAERASLARAFLEANSGDYALLDAKHLSIETAASASDPNQFTVSLTYDAVNLPIWEMYPPIPLPDKIIARSSTIRLGGI
ncbi:MAG: pilus assembly protein [Nitratireductor sp.]|nr:pilus assembly protein [Nitratireductor sp.]